MRIRILVVEDEPIIAEDIAMTLEKEGHNIVGKALNPIQAMDMFANRSPELVILDIALKGDMDGVDLAMILNEKYEIPFVFLTSFSDRLTIERAKPTMPYAYITKPFKDRDLLTAIELAWERFQNDRIKTSSEDALMTVMTEAGLTSSEMRVIHQIRKGHSNEEIAKELYVSINTVKTHLKNVYRKMDVRSRSELMARLNGIS